VGRANMKPIFGLVVCVTVFWGCLYQVELTPFEVNDATESAPNNAIDCTPTPTDVLCAENPCTPDLDDGCGNLVACENCDACFEDAMRPGSACAEQVFDCCDPLVNTCAEGARCAFRQALVEVAESPQCMSDSDCTAFGIAKCLQKSCVTPVVGLSCTSYDPDTEFSAEEGASCNYEADGVTVQCVSGLSCAPISLTNYRCFRFCELTNGAGCERSRFNRCERVDGLPFALGEMLTAQGYGVCVQSCR
jgi:hypothetical protein